MAARTATALLLLLATAAAAAAAADDQQAYSSFAFDATMYPPEAEYDYIIVGGGTAGCPLAATLSESHRVLLLERGGAPHEFPALGTVDGFLRTIVDDGSPDAPAHAFISDDGIPNARGRVLGGGSSINAGFYSRAHPGFFRATPVDWDKKLVNESYQWVEKVVTFRPDLQTWQSAVRDGLLEANVTPYNGFTVEHVAGTKIGASTFDADGRRHSAADLLGLANADNIRVALRATVERVLLSPSHGGGRRRGDQQQAAIGVVYRDRLGGHHRAMTLPGGEVVLSAGALGSPQLLLLSGIGPRPYLAQWGVPVAVHHPDVGLSMYDNPRTSISIIPGVPLQSSLIQVVGIPSDGGDGASESFIEAASTVVHFHPRGETFIPSTSSIPIVVASIIEKVPGPTSSGYLRLNSLDARDNPLVRFNYFESSDDLARCVSGVRRIGDLLNGRAMEEFRLTMPQWWGGGRQFQYLGPPLPENRSDDAALAVYCRRTLATIWHYHGGCLVGKVLDGEFRVMGVDGLRVVDGSTFAVSPGTNPQATLMMMGRYMGRKMVDERRRSARPSEHAASVVAAAAGGGSTSVSSSVINLH